MRTRRVATHRTRLDVTRRIAPSLLVLLSVDLFLAASVARHAQPQPPDGEIGISGYVLAPDGTPVSGGIVGIWSRGGRETMSIGRTGRFRLVPDEPGDHELVVSASGLAAYRVRITVPSSRTLPLPVIRLSPATYFRVRFVSTSGEPITSPRVRRISVDVSGMPIWEPRDGSRDDQIDNDGTMTIGPLPRGVTMLALDMPLLAQTRLPDVHVTGEVPLLDAGNVIVEPGAILHVDVVDITGAPVPEHLVFIEDALPLSPLGVPPVRTNQQGRAAFDRLGAGRYRVHTRSAERCGNGLPLSTARIVSVSGTGILHTRLVIGGQATFRLTSPFGPLRGTSVSASPDTSRSSPPKWLREPVDASPFARPMQPFTFETFCNGATDGDGRVTLTSFPPGPAVLKVHHLNSTWVKRVNVPADGRELAVPVPGGFLPVRVTDVVSGQPVGGAAITWTAGGVRIEATTSGNGEALLEGVSAAAGILAITARRYRSAEVKLSEPPASLHELALTPARESRLQARVSTASAEPLPNAVVQTTSDDPFEMDHVSVTDKQGFVSFADPASRGLHLIASADGLVRATTRISVDSRAGVVLTLARGYRVIATVESPAPAGPYVVRVLNDAGVSMDDFLDIASDRTIEPRGRISLGPLPPGLYVVELHGAREHVQQPVRILDRDVHVTFR